MFDWSGQSLLDSLWKSLAALLQDWIAQHPLAAWLLAHPLWLLAAVLLALFLFAGLLRAVAGLTERFWLLLLKLPILLAEGIWWMSWRLLRPFLPASKPPPANRLSEVLARLEALHQEEYELRQELQALLSGRAKQD